VSSEALPQCEFQRDKLMIRVDVTVNAEPSSVSEVVGAGLAIVAEMKCAARKEFKIETGGRLSRMR
jgi:hypothetical protein